MDDADASHRQRFGERLLATMRPALGAIGDQLAAISELRDRLSGTIRMTAGDHAARTVLWPVIARLLPEYPEVHVEISVDGAFADIVAERFDAGVRLGEALAGLGLAFVMEDEVAGDLASGTLQCVLEDWCPPFPGYHLYYTSKRQPSAAFSVFVNALRAQLRTLENSN